MHGHDAFSYLYNESHTCAYIHSISIPPFKVCNEQLQAVATAVDIFMDQRLAIALQRGET